jgi:hypothetical protein
MVMTDKPYGKGRWYLTLVGVAAFVAGCIGDRAIPIACSTELPGTEYEILLHGPHKGGYLYSIESADGDCGIWELGPIDEPISPRLEILGQGVFRITWGKGPNSAFATFDTAKHLVVADSTKTNPPNRPFETPRYLRPGYRELDPNGEAAKKRRENRASQGKPAADCR